jgi:hypothetical protein
MYFRAELRLGVHFLRNVYKFDATIWSGVLAYLFGRVRGSRRPPSAEQPTISTTIVDPDRVLGMARSFFQEKRMISSARRHPQFDCSATVLNYVCGVPKLH